MQFLSKKKRNTLKPHSLSMTNGKSYMSFPKNRFLNCSSGSKMQFSRSSQFKFIVSVAEYSDTSCQQYLNFFLVAFVYYFMLCDRLVTCLLTPRHRK